MRSGNIAYAGMQNMTSSSGECGFQFHGVNSQMMFHGRPTSMPIRMRPDRYARKLVSSATRITLCSLLFLNSQAEMPMAKAPEPRPVRVITLKVFQMPQA